MAQYLMSDTDGNIVINNVNILGYVEGTGYVRLNGSNIEIGWEEEYSDEDGIRLTKYKMTWSGVNATTVEISDEIRALEVEAEWSDYVNYNGVSYSKRTDADGSEYYVVTSAPADAVIEETINTLPVRR